jgi:hypothetical protein
MSLSDDGILESLGNVGVFVLIRDVSKSVSDSTHRKSPEAISTTHRFDEFSALAGDDQGRTTSHRKSGEEAGD